MVLPGFAVIGMSAYRCRVDSGPEEDIVAELVAGPATAKSLTPGLLRLRQEQNAAALTLGDQIAEPNDLLFILHHPEGNLEPCLSVGRVLGNEVAMLRHDADTRPGSSVLSVFDGGWSVIGMHMRSAGGTGSDASFNMALSLAAILEWLRTTPAWDEIAHTTSSPTWLRRGQSSRPAATSRLLPVPKWLSRAPPCSGASSPRCSHQQTGSD